MQTTERSIENKGDKRRGKYNERKQQWRYKVVQRGMCVCIGLIYVWMYQMYISVKKNLNVCDGSVLSDADPSNRGFGNEG